MQSCGETEQKPSRAIAFKGDVRVTEWTDWRDGHHRIPGDLFFQRGGVLVAEDSVVEFTGRYSNEFRYFWNGGTPITRDTTIGGTLKDDVIAQGASGLGDGEWHIEDTSVCFTQGIVFGGGTFRATRLRQGDQSRFANHVGAGQGHRRGVSRTAC